MIAQGHVFTRHRDYVLDTQNVSGQQVALKRQPVPVSRTHVDDGFHALLLHDNAGAQRAHPHDPIGHIRDDHRIHTSFDAAGVGNQFGNVHSLGGVHFGQNNKLT